MSKTIDELRSLAQNQHEPAIYVLARMVSIHVSRRLVSTPATPNGITLAWGICLLLSSVLLAMGSNPLAAALIALAYVLDCVDGELARLRGRGSNVGSILEQMVHWFTNLAVLAGASIGMYRATGEVHYLLLGMAVVIGDATFHFMYVSLRVAASPGARFGLLADMTRWQFYLMPINTNLIMFAALVGEVGAALWIWGIWSHLGWMIGFTLFFLAESRLEQSRDVLRQALTKLSAEG